MKKKNLILAMTLLVGLSAFAQGSAFTYQGRLSDNGNPANGNHDLQFTLRDAATNQIGNVFMASAVAVTNGLFAVELDFGATAFDGNTRWLEIAVRKNEPPGPPPEFVTLSPRQSVTAAPFALQAGTAAGIAGMADQALDLRAGNVRILRLQPTIGAPNVIAGFSGNFVGSDVVGATISGGGMSDVGGLTLSNVVTVNYGTVGGGFGNAAHGFSSTINGGGSNTVDQSASYSVIGGGLGNIVRDNASTIGGGRYNLIETGAFDATIGGGRLNSMGSDSVASVIAGGLTNVIQAGARFSTVGGGGLNVINTNAAFSTIPGGKLAKTSSYGQLAYASGGFTQYISGSAQSSLFVLRRQTTNSSPTELLLDNGEEGERRIQLSEDGTWLFDIIIVARSSSGASAGFQIKNLIKNVNETTSLLDLPSVTRFGSDAGTGTWAATVEADDANDALVIKVTGAEGTIVRWVASVRTVEVIF